MAAYNFQIIDADNPSGIDFQTFNQGLPFQVAEEDITVLSLDDDDEFLQLQGTDPDGNPGVASNDPSSAGTTGFEPGEPVQFFTSFSVTGSDGSTGIVYALSNQSGSGIQGFAADFPLVPGVTYT
ncbi:hypothetical protein AAD018_005180 [Aestuariibius insulae]|uniref:hypothetical protein n=1 Tax=Aestuariibius insulae TaxID=2058287 RepID=UPI00345EC846